MKSRLIVPRLLLLLFTFFSSKAMCMEESIGKAVIVGSLVYYGGKLGGKIGSVLGNFYTSGLETDCNILEYNNYFSRKCRTPSIEKERKEVENILDLQQKSNDRYLMRRVLESTGCPTTMSYNINMYDLNKNRKGFFKDILSRYSTKKDRIQKRSYIAGICIGGGIGFIASRPIRRILSALYDSVFNRTRPVE